MNVPALHLIIIIIILFLTLLYCERRGYTGGTDPTPLITHKLDSLLLNLTTFLPNLLYADIITVIESQLKPVSWG